MDFDFKQIKLLVNEINPVQPLYTNFIIDKKEINKKEISNNIYPYFLSFSMIFIALALVLIKFVPDLKIILAFIFFVVGLVNILFYYAPPNNLFIIKLVFCLSGGFYTFKSLTLSLKLICGRKDATANVLTYKFLKSLIGSTSFWIGQDLVKKTSSYGYPFFLTILFSFLSAILMLTGSDDESIQTDSIDDLWNILRGKSDEAFSSLFQQGSFIYILLNVAAGILYLHTSSHLGLIFLSKSENEGHKYWMDTLCSWVGWYSSIFSDILISLANFLGFEIKGDESVKITNIESGYLEGILKLLSSLLGLSIGWLAKLSNDSCYYLPYLLLPLAIIAISAIHKVKTIENTMILLTCSAAFLYCSHTMAKVAVTKSSISPVFLLVFVYALENICHVSISLICKKMSATALRKDMCYIGVTSALYLFSLCLFIHSKM